LHTAPTDRLAPAFALGWLLAAGIMAVLWNRQRATKNATAVDVAWAGNLALLAVLFAAALPGDPARRAVLAALGVFHGGRLALHLWRDRVRGKSAEDGRYRDLRAKWGAAADRRFFVFYQAQAALDVLLAVPFALVALRAEPFPSAWDGAALAVFLAGFLLETSADRSLRRFKADPKNRGAVCRDGLWAYSRHPNYFGEWLVWVAYAVLAWPHPAGACGLVAPLLMLFFILKVTGIPPTEAQSVRSRGDAYRAYQRDVSAFVPWFPRRSAA
jgi:steroid 5-alpha reductase family enzyme